MIKNILFGLICFQLFFLEVSAQKVHAFKEFRKLSRPEKCWAIRHPFIAKKVYRLTLSARNAADSIKKTKTLDCDANGGQVDAFRHSYWMALLTQKINWRKAYHLGKAHERGNYRDYKRQRYEETNVPDKISSNMDMCNNLSGIEIGKKLKVKSKKLKVILGVDIQKAVVDSIFSGRMVVIKKNKMGQFLDKSDKLIPADSLKGKWINSKCLVPSNFSRP